MNEPKSFQICTAGDFLAKLVYESRRIKSMDSFDSPAFQYQAMTCMSDAWHLTDWVFRELPTIEKGRFKGPADFRRHMRTTNRYLRICREVADGSKHAVIDGSPQDVATESIPCTGINQTFTLWFIRDGQQAWDPRQVIDGAIAHWEGYFDYHELKR